MLDSNQAKDLNKLATLVEKGISVTLTSGDIEIGAVEIKNGTSDTRVTVLAASTSAAATDTSMVVALNPNSPLGAGSAIIGKVGIDQTTVGTTNAVSLAQLGANAVSTGNGASGTGVLRVAQVNDGTGTLATVTTVSTLTSGNVGGFTTLVQSTVTMSVAGAYATGDYMGTSTNPQSFSNAVRTSGGTGIIKSVLISDKITNANVAMELWIIDRSFTAPTDNAAWDLSDANMLFVQAVIPISTAGWYASSAGQVYFDGTLSYPIKPNGSTSLYYALVARGSTPSFTSGDLTVTLGILQD